MESKRTLIAEDVEGVAVGVMRGGGVVFALIEEGSGLLAFESVVMELDAVHGDDGGGLAAVNEARGTRGKFFQFANAGVDALDDGLGFEPSVQLGD